MSKQRPVLATWMAAAGIAAVYRWVLRPTMYAWGATDAEVAAELPGDDLVEPGSARTTRAITIDAAVEDVWPWLVQIGENRGGFYSYDVLERLVGARIHNADVVHPEWQQLEVGDTVWLAQRYGRRARQLVAAIEPNSHLVLMSAADYDRVQRGEKAFGSWAFCLRPNDGRTRLLVRGSGAPVGQSAFDIVHFLMERGMLRGIRRRAQRPARPAPLPH
ncbi:hypothetical protein [Mycolicibacterium aichiense]|uniref:SRPBCC family protein n=1 Tax=Mycolicibacterium aichiense TaxID=1799 RepID=A0AAD1HLY4_9MYCO|nr:hypothetical protein [Mycolicibacterium aichiense]MCV7019905.1 hypothetical protein [Mycolicibacterium aichiense]BBX07496.1 hypothetical protein MAIC_22990 [Mycolicibacterium aichiense]STZ81310.1 Uncharacterised protein [Mycolicibacterium aichiense]